MAFFYSRNPAMLAPPTIISIARTMAFPALIAMGMVQLMIAGEIDLSTGAMMSLGAVFAAKLIRDVGFPIPVAVVCSLGAAVLVGLTNALFTVKVGVPAVITTIGTSVHRARHQLLLHQRLAHLPTAAGGGHHRHMASPGHLLHFLSRFGGDDRGANPFERTCWGSSLFATGGNKIAAQVCGINTDRVKTICFVVTSLLAGLAGMLDHEQAPPDPR